jgi:CBS domain-containing protein
MRAPVLFLPPHATVLEAARRMESEQRCVVLVGDAATGQVWGIVTERDPLLALARKGGACAERRIEGVMTEAVVSLSKTEFPTPESPCVGSCQCC